MTYRPEELVHATATRARWLSGAPSTPERIHQPLVGKPRLPRALVAVAVAVIALGGLGLPG